MSDLESGLKEAVEKFARVGDRLHEKAVADATAIHGNHGDSYRRALGNGAGKTTSMTAPAIIETIMELTKQAHALDCARRMSCRTRSRAATDAPQPGYASPGNEPAMSIFDRMGLGLLELTRAIESIDRNVKRSLGAVTGPKL